MTHSCQGIRFPYNENRATIKSRLRLIWRGRNDFEYRDDGCYLKRSEFKQFIKKWESNIKSVTINNSSLEECVKSKVKYVKDFISENV